MDEIFFIPPCKNIKDALWMKPWKKYVVNRAQNFIRNCLFMHMVLEINNISVLLVDDIEGTSLKNPHKLYEILKTQKYLCFLTNVP